MLLRYSRTALLAAGFFAYAQAFFHYSRRSEAPAIIPDQVKGKTKPVTRAMSAGSSSRCGSRYQPLLSGIQDSKLKNVEQVSGRWNSISPDGPHTGSHLPWEWVYANKYSKKSLDLQVFFISWDVTNLWQDFRQDEGLTGRAGYDKRFDIQFWLSGTIVFKHFAQ